ncbi:MAG: hypothetical protein WCK49_03670 [Myxococcaceae bacterium]
MLKNLTHLTQDEVKLGNLLAGSLDIAQQAQSFISVVQETLSQILKVPCVLELTRTSIESKPKNNGQLFQVTWPPKAGFIWVECDTKILQNCVYRAIEAQTNSENSDPKLSDLETGIVMYLFSRVFESTKESFALSDSQDKLQGPLLCLSLKFIVGELNSYVKLWVSPEILSVSTNPNALELGKQRCASAEILLSVELGQVELTPEELQGLEAGDIVILENGSLSTVQAHVGDPVCLTLKGSVQADETTKKYSLTIEELS